MKLYIKKIVKNLSGKEFKGRNEDGKEVPLSLGQACVEALVAANPQDQGLPGNIKLTHWELAKKIRKAMDNNAEVVEIPTDRVGIIKNRVLQVFDTVAAGPVCDLLEGEEMDIAASDAQGS